MCDPESALCVVLLQEYFGGDVAKVGEDLMNFGTKTLGQILGSSGLSVRVVKNSLVLLVNHGIVNFNDKRKPGSADYTLQKDCLVGLLRHPRYLQLLQECEGEESRVLVEELCKAGRATASHLIEEAYKVLKTEKNEDPNQAVSVHKLGKVFGALVEKKYIHRCPVNTDLNLTVPKLESDERLQFHPPEIDIKELAKRLEDGAKTDSIIDKDKEVDWTLNRDRLDQLIRDDIIQEAAVRRIDKPAGSIVGSVLNLSGSLYDPWSQASGRLGQSLIQDRVKKDWSEDGFLQHLDQYLTILSSDKTRFLDRVGDAGGGQYMVNYLHIIEEIAAATVENIVKEKFGSKSMRIFRYIREKRYVEENQVQQVVMIPGKETKLLTYQLMENNFVCLQELRKSLAPNVPCKAIYLFYINFDQVVRMVLGLCYTSILNLKRRVQLEYKENARLIEKQDRVSSILTSLEAEGATADQLEEVEEMITPPEKEALERLEHTLQQYTAAQNGSHQTLCILKMYLRHKMS